VANDSRRSDGVYPRAGVRVSVEDMHPFDPAVYQSIGLNDLLAYVVNWLREDGHLPTFETITVVAHRLFPSKFSLVGYPEYPDAARIQLVILHLGPKYVGWLEGKKKTGYHLNDAGAEAARRVVQRLQTPISTGDTASTQHQYAQQDNLAARTATETRLARIRRSQSYRLYQEGQLSSLEDVSLAWDTFQLFINADQLTKAHSYREIKKAAQDHNDKEVLDFLGWIANERPHLIGEKTRRRPTRGRGPRRSSRR
jgi:hypothetical protein